MKLLLDTQLLLWAAGRPDRLSAEAGAAIRDPRNELLFSAASLWEVAIKNMLGGQTFTSIPACCAAAFSKTAMANWRS